LLLPASHSMVSCNECPGEGCLLQTQRSERAVETTRRVCLRICAKSARTEAAQLGDLISERTVRTYFHAGLDAKTATFEKSPLPHVSVLQTFHEAATLASQVDQSIMLLRPSTAATVCTRSVELPSCYVLSCNHRILAIPDSTSMDEIHA
jgi:hypothetical protein